LPTKRLPAKGIGRINAGTGSAPLRLSQELLRRGKKEKVLSADEKKSESSEIPISCPLKYR